MLSDSEKILLAAVPWSRHGREAQRQQEAAGLERQQPRRGPRQIQRPE
jgi:hypothetical protein